tara:strand:+ start:345 stop:542 length:198 start_codon:yes stop_codon:yes gene_type:complete
MDTEKKFRDPELLDEYMVREVYRKLILKYKKQKKDSTNLEHRLHKLENNKWGEVVPGVPKRRRLA